MCSRHSIVSVRCTCAVSIDDVVLETYACMVYNGIGSLWVCKM